jgi:hypothetical protein
MDTLLTGISNSQLFNGSIMLLTNIGGKYLALDMPKNIDSLFEQYAFLRYLILFSIFFMATRDIKISILLTLFYFIVIKFLLNEESRFCIVKKIEKK